MNTTILGIILIIAGSAAIIFRRYLAWRAIEFQNQTFGFHFGKRQIEYSAWLYFIVGGIFVFVGILTLLGKAHWK